MVEFPDRAPMAIDPHGHKPVAKSMRTIGSTRRPGPSVSDHLAIPRAREPDRCQLREPHVTGSQAINAAAPWGRLGGGPCISHHSGVARAPHPGGAFRFR